MFASIGFTGSPEHLNEIEFRIEFRVEYKLIATRLYGFNEPGSLSLEVRLQ